MKIAGIILAILVAVGLFLGVSIGSEDSASDEERMSYTSILEEVESGEAVVLDVRTAEEYTTGHAENAVNFSLQDIQAGMSPEVDITTKLYVYCQSGNRSAQATRLLEEQGYTVVDLGGVNDVTTIGAQLVK